MNNRDEYFEDQEVEVPLEDVDKDMYTVGVSATRLLDTYLPFFRTSEDALDFLKFCVGKYIDPGIDEAPTTPVHPWARSLVGLPHTILSVSDKEQPSDNLKLVLLMTFVESTSKIFFNFREDGYSKKFVRKFFEELCMVKCQELLLTIIDRDNLPSAISFLYETRCKAIHEGHFGRHEFLLDKGWKRLRPDNSLYIYEVLRHVIMTGCINAIRKSFDRDCYERACPGHDKSWELVCDYNECNFSPPPFPIQNGIDNN